MRGGSVLVLLENAEGQEETVDVLHRVAGGAGTVVVDDVGDLDLATGAAEDDGALQVGEHDPGAVGVLAQALAAEAGPDLAEQRKRISVQDGAAILERGDRAAHGGVVGGATLAEVQNTVDHGVADDIGWVELDSDRGDAADTQLQRSTAGATAGSGDGPKALAVNAAVARAVL